MGTNGDDGHGDVDGVDAHHGERDVELGNVGVLEDTARVEEHLPTRTSIVTPPAVTSQTGKRTRFNDSI